MKKFVLILGIFALFFLKLMPVYALESGITKFEIVPICADQTDKYLGINVTLDKTYKNATMFVASYRDNKLTNLAPYGVSGKKSFVFDTTLPRDPRKTNYIFKQETAIKAHAVQNGDYVDLTPDTIKIFVWDKYSIAPKTLCKNALTPEVIKAANADVVKSLEIVPEATMFIRDNHLAWEEDYLEGKADTWDTHLFPIMDYIDICAKGAIEDSKTHLLTSLFAQSRYRDELSQIRQLINSAPAAQKAKIKDLLDATALGKEYFNALNNAMKFLDFSLTEL